MKLVLCIIGFFACYSAFIDANQKVIVINPGHSMGYDSGATSQYKDEAQVNQELAGRVVRLLATQGYKVYITHTTDSALAQYRLLDQAGGSSLARVGTAANSVNPDLTMSIHHNSGGTSSSGTELYWSSYRSFDADGVYTVPGLWADGSAARRDNSPCAVASESLRFAQIMEQKLTGAPKLPFRQTVERDDYLPAHSTSPCILYEGGFLSNPSEAQYLASDEYQNEAAKRIVDAINEFFGGAPATENDTELPKINTVSTNVTETGNDNYTVSANVSDNSGIKVVRVATWTEANGQDDLVWKDMKNDGSGNWSVTVKTDEHNNETGSYINHVYAYDNADNFVGVIAPTVTVASQSSMGTGLKVEKNNSKMATAFANNLGGTKYKFAVWSELNGQDDLIWGEGTPQVNGSAKFVINRADHKNDAGKYIIHCYTDDMKFAGANEIDFGTITTSELKATISGNTINITMSGLKSPDGVKSVRFAVYSEDQGTDDVRWYEVNENNGSYNTSVSKNNHKGDGIYWVHAYLTDDYGLDQFIGGVSLDTSANSSSGQSGPQTTIDNIGGNQIRVTVTNVGANLSVFTPTWSEANGQDDLHWYEANRQGDIFTTVINLNDHTGLGTYFVHIYTRDSAGTMTFINAYSFEVQQAQPQSQAISLDTPIMGNSGTSAAQLVNFYNENTWVEFPQYYQTRGVSLAQFAQMYVDECAAEGVRADLAFCQAMHETGFLGFGGDVSISQFNFAGLGATGGGVPGENFAAQYGDDANGIRMGIRAQIQHLKAYGSTEPLNQPCVDTRFNYVTRGQAPTVAGLSGTWAADTSYAEALVKYMQRIK